MILEHKPNGFKDGAYGRVFFDKTTALLHKPTDKALFRNIIRK